MRKVTSIFAAFFLLLVLTPSCQKSHTPAGPRTCKADDECTIACESRESCCHNPYCEGAQHVDDARDIRAENEKRCTSKDQSMCPRIGARVEPTYRVVPRCTNGACVAEKVPK